MGTSMSCVMNGESISEQHFDEDPIIPDHLYEPKECAQKAPLHCLSACGLEPIVGQSPTCEDGQWLCSDGVTDSSCPEFYGDCDLGVPCGYGYTCVQSLKHPIPADAGICRKGVFPRDGTVESCSAHGTIESQQLVDDQINLTGGLIKIAGRVGVTMNCSNEACFSDEPCCNTCMANYMLEVKDPYNPSRKVNLLIKTETVPCMGTNCGVSCTPMVVGETYRLWGLLENCQGQSHCTLLFMGACPL